MKVKSNAEIKEFCQEIANGLNLIVADVEFKQGKNPSLTIFIDKEGGVDLDTCELFHRAIDEPIDQLDPTFGAPYTLNVSSLGIDRPFKSDADFNSHIGERVEVKLVNSIKGKKFYDGILTSYDGKVITLKVDEKTTFTIDLKNVVKVNEYIDFI
ncbi:MAG: ribosome maturation factor RimP [Clostridia bacterium]|nr:ribosome maturation factor RimP [Clostridia bacterium]